MINGEQWSQYPAVHLGVEDRDAHTIGGEHVGVGVGETPDQALAPQAAQVVGRCCQVNGPKHNL